MKEIKLEEALKRLNEIFETLENGESDLDKSLELFQEGIELVKQCESKLKSIEEASVKIIEGMEEKPFEVE